MSTTPTIKDVAEAAGVAVSTVSSTLNGKASQRRISPDTQQRVLAAVRQLGYQANTTARNMALGTVPASIPQPSQIATPESQLPSREIALVLSASSPAESLALIPSLEPVLTAANYRLFVVTLPAEPAAADERLTRMLDDEARPASGRKTVGFLCCPTVYSTVSALLAGRCPAIVLWQDAAKAMVAKLADPSAAVPVPPVVPVAPVAPVVPVAPPVVVPPPVIPVVPLPITPTSATAPVVIPPPPAPVVIPPVAVAPEPAPPPSPAPEPVIIPEPAPVVMETPVPTDPVSQQESGSAGGFALPEEKLIETVETPAEPVTPREPDPPPGPAPEPVIIPEPAPVVMETPVPTDPVSQQESGSAGGFALPEEKLIETVETPAEPVTPREPDPPPGPAPEPIVISEPEPIAPVAPTPAPVPEPAPEIIPEPMVVPVPEVSPEPLAEPDPGSQADAETPAPEEVQPSSPSSTP
jgi:transcriptional regulator with XRE-family HTH domain